MVGDLCLLLQPCSPELTVTPRVPASRAQHLDLRGIKITFSAGDLGGCGHGRERLAEGGREHAARRDRLDHLELCAVEMCDQRYLRPEPVRGVELRREVVKVEHVGAISTRSAQRRFPHRAEMLGELGPHRSEHHVRRTGAVLVRGVHRRRSRDRVAARLERPERVSRVKDVNVETVEERRGMGLLPGQTQRSDRERNRPTRLG